MNELIKEMQERGFTNIKQFRLRGKVKPVLEFIEILATTEDGIETDPNWYALRSYLARN